MPVDVTPSKKPLAETDPEAWRIFEAEVARQENTLELIASENHVSRAVYEAVGSVFTNKYAEGYPGRRYYGGCANMDAVEDLARERLKKLFGAQEVNVQPHSGSQANQGSTWPCCSRVTRFCRWTCRTGGT